MRGAGRIVEQGRQMEGRLMREIERKMPSCPSGMGLALNRVHTNRYVLDVVVAGIRHMPKRPGRIVTADILPHPAQPHKYVLMVWAIDRNHA